MIDRSIFFIHIPKTGGATIEELIKETYPPQAICPYYYAKDFLAGDHAPDAFRIFYGHNWFYTEQILPAPCFVFTYLRHPVGLAISVYEHIRRNPHTLHDLLITEAASLADFARHRSFSTMVSNAQTRILGADTDFKELYKRVKNGQMDPRAANQKLEREIVLEPDATMLERARRRIEQLDFVGITEYFTESTNILADKLNLAVPNSLPRHNAASAKDLEMRSEYSDYDIESLLEINRYDVQLYDFALNHFRSLYAPGTEHLPPPDKHVQRYLHLR